MNKALEALENIKGNCDLFDEGYQWDNEFSKQFDSDIDIIEKALLEADPLYIIRSTYFDLCGELTYCCRKHPDTPWDQIPEAVAAFKTLEGYEAFVLKYFKIDLSPKQENK